MSIIAAEKSGTHTPIPEGVYIGVCARVVDLGTTYSEMFKKFSRKVMISWELPDETIDIDGDKLPKMISRDYTLSLSKKATLRQHLEAWRGKKFTDEELKGFDLVNVMGAGCQLQIVHNDNGWENVAAIMSLPKGVKKPEVASEKIYFDLTADDARETIHKLPEWVQDKIRESDEWKAIAAQRAAGEPDAEGFVQVDDTEDLPF